MSALGFMYATGRGVDPSLPKSLVYHTFAGTELPCMLCAASYDCASLTMDPCSASGDDMEAVRVLGNRYLYGLGVVKNCETSLVAYEKAARTLIEEVPSPVCVWPWRLLARSISEC